MWRPFESILGAFVLVSFPLFTDFLLLLAVVLAAAVFLEVLTFLCIDRLVRLVVLSSYQICYFSCFISVPGLSFDCFRNYLICPIRA